MEKAYLLLDNGVLFEGIAFGAFREAEGEITFNTDVVGYLETLTDPANSGKLLLQTFPLIGNYGFISADVQNPATPAGYIVRELCPAPSNFRAEDTLEAYLAAEGIPGIAGIDTRALIRILRENGVCKGKILYTKPEVNTDAAE